MTPYFITFGVGYLAQYNCAPSLCRAIGLNKSS